MEIASATQHEIVIVSSDYVRFEIEKIDDPLKRKDVRGFERALSSVNITNSRHMAILAKDFSFKCGLNSLDVLHVSAACWEKLVYS